MDCYMYEQKEFKKKRKKTKITTKQSEISINGTQKISEYPF